MISSTAKASFAALGRPCRFQALVHARVCNTPRCQLSTVGTPVHRRFSQSVKSAYPRKDSQDKDSINTEASEYSKSATDDEGARQEDAAFDPSITDPQQQKDKAGEGTEGTDTNNPLEVSPANPDVSQQRGATEGGAENSSSSSGTTSDRERSSGGSGPQKGSRVS